jgi:CheY-like chemotaxis protein
MANILIVDDTPYTHRVLNIILRRNNHTVQSARNGMEAIDCLTQTTVDMLITDINMPILDGFGLLDWLRADDRYKKLPVIVITASGQKQLSKIAAEKGATGFLTQPFSSIELGKLVKECLGAC